MLLGADGNQVRRGVEFEPTLFTAKPIGRTRHDHDDDPARELPPGPCLAALAARVAVGSRLPKGGKANSFVVNSRRARVGTAFAVLALMEPTDLRDSTDEGVLKTIKRLIDEEQSLYGHGSLDDGDVIRLEALMVELDQCWDLLRQRRALREFGHDPEAARLRPASVVEKYKQ